MSDQGDTMTVDDVQGRVEEIDRMSGDDETAHSEEDKLYRDVLTAIAEGRAVDGAAMAAAALKTQKIAFARWCA